MVAAALVMSLAASLVEVAGSTTCPRPEQVAERVRALVPSGQGADTQHDVAALSSTGDSLTVELRDSAGRTLATRTLATGADCADLAAAAAVVIVAWEAELRPAQPPPLPAAPQPRPPWRFAIAALFDADLAATSTGDRFAPGGAIAVSFGPSPSRWGAQLLVAATDLRAEPLGRGQARWTRPSLSLGPSLRLVRARRFLLDLDASLTLAMLVLQGSGVDNAQSALDLDVGLGAGLRATVPLGRVGITFGASAIGWLRRQQASIVTMPENTVTTIDLPRLDVLLTVGIAAGRLQ